MALTRPTIQNLNTNNAAFNDSLTVTNFANVANRDIGQIFDRSQASKPNVAIIWSESRQSFQLAYTNDSGQNNGNITVLSNADIIASNLQVSGLGTFLTNVTIGNGVDASSTSTGALKVTGGVGVTANVFAGNILASEYYYANGVVLSRAITITGDATGTGFTGSNVNVTLSNTGVTLGVYGNSTAVPVITVDEKGRILDLNTSPVYTDFTLIADSGSGNVSGGGTITLNGYANEINTSVAGSTFTFRLPTNLVTPGSVTITGNLTVNGNTTFINANTITTNDKTITLANNQSVTTALDGGGIELGTGGVVTLLYSYAENSWIANVSVTPYANLSANLGYPTNYWKTGYIDTLNAVSINGTLLTAAQPNVTSLGTLTSLTLSGTLTGTTLNAAQIGNTGSALTGTIQTSNQLFITNVGKLLDLNVAGPITGSIVNAATFGNAGAVFTGETYTASGSFNGPHNGTLGSAGGNTAIVSTLSATANATVNALTVNNSATIGSTLGVTGNLVAGNISTGQLSATGITVDNLTINGGLQNTPVGNAIPNTGDFTSLSATGTFTGTVINAANIGNVGTLLTGTLQTADQPNVTHLGNLTNLTIIGTTTGSTIEAAQIGNVGTTLTGTLNTSSQPNITEVGVLGNLVVAGQIDAATIQAAVIGNTGAGFTGATYTASGSFNGPHNGTLGSAGGNAAIVSTLSATSTATVQTLVSNSSIAACTSVTSGSLITGTIDANGNATVNALTVNNSATVGTTLGVTGNINGSSASLTGSATLGSSLSAAGGIQNTQIGNVTPNSAQFTTVNTSGNTTVSALTANGSITAGATLSAAGGIQNTPIGNVTPNSSQFTTVNASGNTTVSALTVNNSSTIGGTLGVTANISGSNLTLTDSQTIGGTLGVTGNVTVTTGNIYAQRFNSTSTELSPPVQGSDIGYRVTVYDFNQNSVNYGMGAEGGHVWFAVDSYADTDGFKFYGNVNQVARISGIGNFYLDGNITASSAGFGNSVSATGNITGGGLTSNGSITAITTLRAAGGIQNTPIGNVTPNSAQFTTVNASGNITAADLTVNSSATIGTTLGVTGNVIVGNLRTDGTVLITNTTNSTGANTGALIVQGGASFEKDIHVLGNVYTTNLIAINANTLSVQDPLLYLTANTPYPYDYDIGFFSQFSVTSNVADYQHTGFVRDVDDGVWKLFSNVVPEPGITVDFANAVYDSMLTGTHTVLGQIIGNSTMSVYGTATVGNLVANGSISAASISFTGANVAGNITTNGLTVNTSAVVGTTLQAVAGIQNTVVGNVTPASSYFTSTDISGNATVNGLTVNTSAVIGTTLQAQGGIQNTIIGNVTPNSAQFTTVNASSNVTVADLTVNSSITLGTTLSAAGGIQNTPIGNVTPSSAIFTNESVSGNSVINGLTVNTSAVIGTTFQAQGGVQNTPIGNGTASSGAFTTLSASGLSSITDSTDSTGSTTGALIVSGGVGIAKALNVGTTATLGNITHSNVTISSNITNQGLNINPNGTGQTTINSGLNNSRTVINGTSANLFVVSGNQVGINVSTITSGVTFEINATDSMKLPAGDSTQRPAGVAGMFRYNSVLQSTEFYTGSEWKSGAQQFTMVVANVQQGDGSTVAFTIPTANASTAGTIVSINGVVQEPVTAYSITGNVVTFTEAPSLTDTIDFRTFTTTSTVTGIVDTVGTTGVFVEASPGDKTVTFKNQNSTTVTINPDGYVDLKANGIISSSPSITAGTGGNTMDSWSGTTYKAAKYVVTARDSGSTTWTALEALVVTNGAANAVITTWGTITAGASATPQITLSATAVAGVVTVTATGAAAGTVVNFTKTYVVGS